MNNTIKRRVKLSAPGKDGSSNPIIKLERNAAARMFVELMKTLLLVGQYLDS
jgi:hypothetical protein